MIRRLARQVAVGQTVHCFRVRRTGRAAAGRAGRRAEAFVAIQILHHNLIVQFDRNQVVHFGLFVFPYGRVELLGGRRRTERLALGQTLQRQMVGLIVRTVREGR